MSTKNPPTAPPTPSKDKSADLVDKLATPKAFASILITVLAVWFIVANNARVRIHLWVAWIDVRMWVVLLITFIAGGALGYMLAHRRKKAKEKEKEKSGKD